MIPFHKSKTELLTSLYKSVMSHNGSAQVMFLDDHLLHRTASRRALCKYLLVIKQES
jgi:hypothetical protein